MAFAQDLLDQAYHLATLESGAPKQSSLRLAVSAAYYALFHLLIDEAVGHWGVPRHRSILARTFDHGKKGISEDRIRSFYNSGQPPSGAELKNVAQTFVQLQEQWHTASADSNFNLNHYRIPVIIYLAKSDERGTMSTAWQAGAHQADFLARFFRACARFILASRRSTSSFVTLNILRTALSMRSASVLPGT